MGASRKEGAQLIPDERELAHTALAAHWPLCTASVASLLLPAAAAQHFGNPVMLDLRCCGISDRAERKSSLQCQKTRGRAG